MEKYCGIAQANQISTIQLLHVRIIYYSSSYYLSIYISICNNTQQR